MDDKLTEQQILLLGVLLASDNNFDKEHVENNLAAIEKLRSLPDNSKAFLDKLDQIEEILKKDLSLMD